MQYVPVTVMVPQEITIPAEPCSGNCGAYVVRPARWKSIKREVRKQLRGKFKMEKTRGACTSCYDRARATGDHIDLPTKQISAAVFAEEYNLMREQGMTAYDVRIALGMTVAAFEKAIERGVKAQQIAIRPDLGADQQDIRERYAGYGQPDALHVARDQGKRVFQ